MQNVPKHIGVILDGNRRWAKRYGLPSIVGHTEGAKKLKDLVRFSKKAGAEAVTVYTLSTENLKSRSEDELAHLFSLFKKLVEYLSDLHEEDVRVRLVGNIDDLPKEVVDSLREVENRTKDHNSMTLCIAVNYGGRDEIVRAVNVAVAAGRPVTEAYFGELLDTSSLPDVDLIIRTGGHRRLSNFLLWQAAYAELYFTDTFWPDFSEKLFMDALDFFNSQERNRGK